VRTSLLLFNRDLRVHDHPALCSAATADLVIPLFVLDEAILGRRFACPNRLAFMLDSLRDLAESLEGLGAPLLVRRGDPVREALRLATEFDATEIHASADFSSYARRREKKLAAACEKERIRLQLHPGVTIVPPGDVVPGGGDHFKVFSPYYRAWSEVVLRPVSAPPKRLAAPRGADRGRLPPLERLTSGRPSPDLAPGGEQEGRRRMRSFLRRSVSGYADAHDDLAGDGTSRLSAYLRFGCLSPLELLQQARARRGGGAFVRQLCWRDFHHQVLDAFPSYPHRDYRPRGDSWSRSRRALQAWKEGRTGYPIVDAGMRQLALEGFMHNRARLIVASFLTKDLYIDWRQGARHFWDLLADGDIANNSGNWQWVAGTGNDPRPNRVFNPILQAKRFDPRGDYVRRYLPELEAIGGGAVHEPWKLGPLERHGIDYPEPIVDHAEAVVALRAKRSLG
jgi:deoxyribodipyrimidine photo-lyase